MATHDAQDSAPDVHQPAHQPADDTQPHDIPPQRSLPVPSDSDESPATALPSPIPAQRRTVEPISGAGNTPRSARGTSPATTTARIAGAAVGHRSDVVVVGVDASLGSSDAVDWAADVCAQRHATLRLVHAYPLPTVPNQRGRPTPADRDGNHNPNGAMLLEEVAAGLRNTHPGLAIDSRPLPGDPDDVLRRESERARLTVVGANGTGHVAGPPLGSVASALSAVNPAPVAIIHPHHRTIGRGPVVVGVDGSPASDAAVAFAFQEAAVRQADLVAVHAWQHEDADSAFPGYPTLTETAEIEGAEHALLSQRLAGWREKYPDVVVYRKIINGRSTPALLEFGQSAQLVAVGSRGRGYSSRLLGSTSHALIMQCECPVVVASPLSCP